MQILALAALLVCAFSNIAVVAYGIVRGKVYPVAGAPPIVRKTNPVKYLVCLLVLSTIAAACVVGVVRLGALVLD